MAKKKKNNPESVEPSTQLMVDGYCVEAIFPDKINTDVYSHVEHILISAYSGLHPSMVSKIGQENGSVG